MKLRFEAQLLRDPFDGVDRGAVDIGVTGVLQPRVADVDAESLQQALEGRRAAVHRRGLNDLRCDEPPMAERRRHGRRLDGGGAGSWAGAVLFDTA